MTMDFIARGIAQSTATAVGLSDAARIDLRQFAEGVGVGNETKDTDALHAAWIEAGQRTFPSNGTAKELNRCLIMLPPTQLLIGSGLKSEELGFPGAASFIFRGTGANSTRITLTDPDEWLIDTQNSIGSLLLSDLQVHGGAGAFRQRSTNSTVSVRSGALTFERCAFSDYSQAAIASNAADDPYYHVWNCKFTGYAQSRAIVLPPGGGHVIGGGTWINGHKYGIVLRSSKDTVIGYVRFGGTVPVDPRTDIWMIPESGVAGKGLVVENCFHGNEGDNSSDRDILIADADTGANPDHANNPTWESYDESTAGSDGEMRHMRLLNNHHSCDAGRTRGIIFSRCEKLSMVFDGNLDGSYPYIVEFDETVIPSLSLGNRWSQTSRISVRPQQTFGVGVVPNIQASNLPGFGFVDGELAGDPSVPGPYGSDLDEPLMTDTMANLNSGTCALSGLLPDAANGTEAIEITFDGANGRCWQRFDLAEATAGRLAWLEFDVKQADNQSVSDAQVRIGTAYNNYFRVARFWAKPFWQRIAIPFILPEVPTNLLAIFAATTDGYQAGVSDKLLIGRIDAYHGSCRK